MNSIKKYLETKMVWTCLTLNAFWGLFNEAVLKASKAGDWFTAKMLYFHMHNYYEQGIEHPL